MGVTVSSLVLFPAPTSSYLPDHPHMVWIEESYADHSVLHYQLQAENRKKQRGQTLKKRTSSHDNHSKQSDSENSSSSSSQLMSSSSGDTSSITSTTFPALLLRHHSAGSRHVLLYFHGNSCDLGEIYEELIILHQYLSCHILAIEFPGYGVCAGRHTTTAEGIDRWSRAAFNWLVDVGVETRSIVLFGRSIGTGPAATLAADLKQQQIPFAALVLHCPYISVHRIISDYSTLGTWLIPNFWDIQQCLSVIGPTTPLLIVHGQNDDVVPHYHGETLFKEYSGSPSVKEGFFPEESEHNSYLIVEDLGIPLEAFLREKSLSRHCASIECYIPRKFFKIPPDYQYLLTKSETLPPASPTESSTLSQVDDGNSKDATSNQQVHQTYGADPSDDRMLSRVHQDSSPRRTRSQSRNSDEVPIGETANPLRYSFQEENNDNDPYNNSDTVVDTSNAFSFPVKAYESRTEPKPPSTQESTSRDFNSKSTTMSIFCSCYPESKTPDCEEEIRY